jgi:hypothetical protein
MADANPYAPSPLPGTAPALPPPAYAPSQLPGVVPSAGAVAPSTLAPSAPAAAPANYAPSSMSLPDLTKHIENHESGGKNVTSPAGAIGPRQLMPATFARFARPGENINNPADNRAVGDRLLAYLYQKYNGDAARVAVAYQTGEGNVAPPGSPTPWKRNIGDVNQRVSQYVADTVGKGGGGATTATTATTATPSTPAAPAAPTSNAQRFADAYRQGNAGGMLAALSAGTGDQGQGKSALDSVGDAMKSPQLPTPTPALPAIAQAPPDTAASAQQLLGQVLANQQAPLSWSSRPFGAQAGPQAVPGVTLNSSPVLSQYALNPMYSG